MDKRAIYRHASTLIGQPGVREWSCHAVRQAAISLGHGRYEACDLADAWCATLADIVRSIAGPHYALDSIPLARHRDDLSVNPAARCQLRRNLLRDMAYGCIALTFAYLVAPGLLAVIVAVVSTVAVVTGLLFLAWLTGYGILFLFNRRK